MNSRHSPLVTAVLRIRKLAIWTAAAVDLEGTATRRACGTGALWTFVLARASTATRAKLDELAAQSSCVRPEKR